ncbi:MAG: D-glycerate dehydrogenase [Pseudolabrys sp.]|nr:D-glycerate dehydrogenase [Pseudolabrys sp.]
MSRPRVFVTQPIAETALARLRAVAEVEVNPDGTKVPDQATLIAGVKRADILFALLHDTVSADVLAANPKLKAVTSMTITPDRIDVKEATRRGIIVTNIPAVVTEATADICFAILLAVARRVVEGDNAFRKGIYPGSQGNYFAGAAVSGKTLGVVGAGRIGQAVARRGRGFGMKILYTDPVRLPEALEKELGAKQVPFNTLLAESDFVSLHPQMSPETRHLMGAAQFAKMKKTAYIVNTSRGPVIDEKALVKALKAAQIAGAALDVYENEPAVEPELIGMKNVVLTPHLGSGVLELREGMAHIVTDNAIAVIEGKRPPNIINPEVLK